MVRFHWRLREEDISQTTIKQCTCRGFSDVKRDVSTTDLVSYIGGERPILNTGENAGAERLDARTALFGPGGCENIIFHCEVQE